MARPQCDTARRGAFRADVARITQDLAPELEILNRRASDRTARHVRRLVAERRIPYLKVGSLLRFDPAEINAWLRHLAVRSDIVDLNRSPRRSG